MERTVFKWTKLKGKANEYLRYCCCCCCLAEGRGWRATPPSIFVNSTNIEMQKSNFHISRRTVDDLCELLWQPKWCGNVWCCARWTSMDGIWQDDRGSMMNSKQRAASYNDVAGIRTPIFRKITEKYAWRLQRWHNSTPRYSSFPLLWTYSVMPTRFICNRRIQICKITKQNGHRQKSEHKNNKRSGFNTLWQT